MNKRNVQLITIIVCLLSVSCTYNKNEMMKYKDEGFSLMYPSNFKIEKETPIEDFNIYRFIYRGKVVLSAYSGNHPSLFENSYEKAKTEKIYRNSLSFESFRVKDPEGKDKREVLIKFMDNRDWPEYMHFWYSGLEPHLEEVAEGIIFSTSPK